MNPREQACWLALVFESKLTVRTINAILVVWCKQLGKTLEDFFAADAQEWQTVCRLNDANSAKLMQAKEKLVAQAFLVEQLQHADIHMLTVLDDAYPKSLKLALDVTHIPPVLFYIGSIDILTYPTAAIIGSRHAQESSLDFTRATARYLANNNTNVISGYARGVDRAAYEGAIETDGYTTIVLPHGIRKLSKVQLQKLQPKIEANKVLVLSQFHPDAPWMISRAMERNNVVTGLAQVVVVAESDTKGGTWEGANGALKQKRRLFVCQNDEKEMQSGNKQLLERGGKPLHWPTQNVNDTFAPLLETTQTLYRHQRSNPLPPNQLSLMAVNNE
jgi:Predicted Rossmann fold nucleotide-binding protein involved in DNA uptake